MVCKDIEAEVDRELLRNAIEILNSTGKVNTLDKNPMFTYDLVKDMLEVQKGIKFIDNPFNVLTNNPPFLFHKHNYLYY